MILLLSPYQNASEYAAQIERATKDTVTIVNTVRLAMSALRSHEYAMVIADENLLESAPGTADSLVQRMETAAPLIADLACLRPEKVAKLAFAAQRRLSLELRKLREKALADLRSEIKSEITGLLMTSELALKTAGLPPSAIEKLNRVMEIAQRMQLRFSPGQD